MSHWKLWSGGPEVYPDNFFWVSDWSFLNLVVEEAGRDKVSKETYYDADPDISQEPRISVKGLKETKYGLNSTAVLPLEVEEETNTQHYGDLTSLAATLRLKADDMEAKRKEAEAKGAYAWADSLETVIKELEAFAENLLSMRDALCERKKPFIW